ncbi:MAG TPA: MFS transporter [Gemmatimonadaceae bacterium]
MTVEASERHPGYDEAIFCSGARVLASGAMFAGLALALGGGHFTIATLAALPYVARVMHLAIPELLRRYHAGRVALFATWLERGGFLVAALFGIVRPGELTIPGFLAGFAIGVVGQQLYDGSMASLHSEATTPETYGRYIAIKSRWGSAAGLTLGILASMALDATERWGVPAHIARSLAIAGGVTVHLLIALPLARLRARARRVALMQGGPTVSPPTPTTPNGAQTPPRSWLVLPRTPEQWRLVRFALAWGFAIGFSTRQGEALAIGHLGVSVGTVMFLSAIAVGAGVIGAKSWGQLGDRFGGKGLMSIAFAGLALDPVWWLAALFIHPAFLFIGYLLYGICNSGWNITVSMTLVRTAGAGAERIRAFVVYSVAFGLAAGLSPMLGGALLDVVDARYGPTAAYGALFAFALALRVSAYPWLRQVPAPNAERGAYVSAVVLRAVRWRLRKAA